MEEPTQPASTQDPRIADEPAPEMPQVSMDTDPFTPGEIRLFELFAKLMRRKSGNDRWPL